MLGPLTPGHCNGYNRVRGYKTPYFYKDTHMYKSTSVCVCMRELLSEQLLLICVYLDLKHLAVDEMFFIDVNGLLRLTAYKPTLSEEKYKVG